MDSLATLNVSHFVETSKFQPLTAAAPPAASETKQANDVDAVPSAAETETLQQQDPAKQAIIERILTEERLREQFSVDHIIRANLPNEAAEEKTDLHREETNADYYWAMTTPENLSTEIHSKRTEASYWDWPTKSKQQKQDDLIQAILEQERVRQLFTVDHLVLNLQKEAALQQKKESLVPQNDSYWEWDAKVDLNDDAMQPVKEQVIQHILEAEKLRQQFSVATLERKLVQEQKVSEADVVSHANPSNDDYWAGF